MGTYRTKQSFTFQASCTDGGTIAERPHVPAQSLKLRGFAKVVRRSKADSSLIYLFTSAVRNGGTS